jgi:hypothetical protein
LASVLCPAGADADWRPALRKPASIFPILRLSEVIWRRCAVIVLLSAVLVERISLRAKREISALRVTASVDMRV